MTDRLGALALASLLVVSAVVAGVGPSLVGTAEAESSNYTYQYTGSPEVTVVNVTSLNSSDTIEAEYTAQKDGSLVTLARKTYKVGNIDNGQLLFFNFAAYESVNVTVSGVSSGQPTFDTRTRSGAASLSGTGVGSTGGDTDLQCGIRDKIHNIIGKTDVLDCTAQPGSTTFNKSGLDAEQTETHIYETALAQKASGKNYQTTLNNYLADTRTQARILGKNAYIRALNNGSSESVAQAEAKQAVSNYYAKKQINLISAWNQQAYHYQYIKNIAENESGISNSYVGFEVRSDQYNNNWWYQGLNQNSTTLVNGSTSPVVAYHLKDDSSPGSHHYYWTVASQDGKGTGGYDGFGNLTVNAPNSNYEKLTYLNDGNNGTGLTYTGLWTEIENQNQQVQNDMESLVNNTYSSYQRGEINSTDLVDPYVLASERSPGSDFQTWAAAQLTLMGQNTPEMMDSAGEFEVTTESGKTYEGILTSPENPPSGQFKANTTYDLSNVNGTQYLITSDQIMPLSGNITLGNITGKDGQRIQNTTIRKVTYETTNVSALKDQYEDLAYRQAQLEAREEALRAAAGSGLFGSGQVSSVVALGAVGVLLALAALND